MWLGRLVLLARFSRQRCWLRKNLPCLGCTRVRPSALPSHFSRYKWTLPVAAALAAVDFCGSHFAAFIEIALGLHGSSSAGRVAHLGHNLSSGLIMPPVSSPSLCAPTTMGLQINCGRRANPRAAHKNRHPRRPASLSTAVLMTVFAHIEARRPHPWTAALNRNRITARLAQTADMPSGGLAYARRFCKGGSARFLLCLHCQPDIDEERIPQFT